MGIHLGVPTGSWCSGGAKGLSCHGLYRRDPAPTANPIRALHPGCPDLFFPPMGTRSFACRILRESVCPSPKRIPEPGGLAGAEIDGLLGGFQPRTISAGGGQQ
ncbi:MAG: hypothetical protein H6Q82_2142 [Deltaproteobacteria bacterium]|nr:hypothetical protein [Deltaproteobacteria bacterium]